MSALGSTRSKSFALLTQLVCIVFVRNLSVGEQNSNYLLRKTNMYSIYLKSAPAYRVVPKPLNCEIRLNNMTEFIICSIRLSALHSSSFLINHQVLDLIPEIEFP